MATATKKKTDKIAVTRIEIEIGRKVVSLTPDELKELRDILDATFPKETTKTVYVPGAPIIIKEPVYRDWPWKRWHEPFWYGKQPPRRISSGNEGIGMPHATMRLTCSSKS